MVNFRFSFWVLSLPLVATSAFSPAFVPKTKAKAFPQGAAASAEEDLKLTTEIILGHIRSQGGMDSQESMDSHTEEVATDVSGDFMADIDFSLPAEMYETLRTPDTPENDLMIRAALGQTVEKTPIWLFRQAGRHLPEYTAYKEETGRNFLDLLAYPDSVAECTLQPLRRYEVDAAILFSDILVIPEALGIEVTMPGGVGIQVPNPLESPEDVAKRIPSIDEMTPEFVQDKLAHVVESVKQIRLLMEKEGISRPLIGFSAAPWTLLFYMVGGSSKKNVEIGKTWLNEHPKESIVLLQTLTKIVIEYVAAQIEAGAHMLQIFEAMGMMIDEENFYKYAMPCLEAISVEIKKRYPGVPLMVFSRGACFANSELAKLGYDVVTIDGSVDRSTARSEVEEHAGLQGNYDPRELIEDGTKTPETVRQTAQQLLSELGPQRLIANLGEGLSGKESTDLVKAFVDCVHEESASMITAAQAS